MGLFDIDQEQRLRNLYHRAEVENNYQAMNTRKFPYLDRELSRFARENHCSYDEAFVLAKTGKRIGRLAKEDRQNNI